MAIRPTLCLVESSSCAKLAPSATRPLRILHPEEHKAQTVNSATKLLQKWVLNLNFAKARDNPITTKDIAQRMPELQAGAMGVWLDSSPCALPKGPRICVIPLRKKIDIGAHEKELEALFLECFHLGNG